MKLHTKTLLTATEKTVMKNKLLLTALATTALASGSASAGVLYGPTDIEVPESINDVTSLTTGDLGGNDELIITYSITRGTTDAGDSWLTMVFNRDPADNKFTFGSVFGVFMKTKTHETNGYSTPNATGSWGTGGNTGPLFGTGSPAEHAVRVTVSGLSTGGFSGVKNVVVEIDHNASTVVTADRTFTGTFDFGGTDEGLSIDLRSHGGSGVDPEHTANNFTITAVPEPGSLALLAVGGLCMFKRRRRG